MKLQDVGRRLAVGICLLVPALLLGSGSAIAQENKTEISGGWSYAHESDVSIPAGWYASAGRYVNNWLGIVGEVNGHYKTLSTLGTDVKTNIHIFGAGPKFAYRKNPRFTPYFETLAGAGRASAGVSGFGASVHESVTGFAYQSNWGVEVNNRSGSLGVRVEVGGAGIRSEGEWATDTLFNAGVVIRR